MEAPRISAIVCTYQRPGPLAHALESLLGQTLAGAEVLVVDNAPDRGAAPIAERLGVRYVVEPRPGLSRARNAGVAAARAPILAFLDDDAVASPTWLDRIVHAFSAGRPRPACVGGRVEPLYETPRPPWLPDQLLGLLSVVDWPERAGPLARRRWLAGTNIAFEREALLAVGGFSERLGRRPGTLLGMEEVTLVRRLLRSGRAVHYDPTIVVAHAVPAERMTRAWLHRRAYWQGVSEAIADREASGSAGRLAMLAANAALVAARPWRLAAAALPSAPEPRRLAAECAALARAGYVMATLGRLA